MPVALLAGAALVACAPQRAGDVPLGAPPAPQDAGVTTADAFRADADPSESTSDDASADAPDASSSDAGFDATAAVAAPSVVIERPYLTWARPRPKGEVAAGAHDELLGRWNVGGTSSPTFPSNRPGFHPGTRVKVDTRVVSGRLPKTAAVDRRTGKRAVVLSEISLLARARKLGYWPYRLCFERGVQERGTLKGGETVLRFAVEPSGRVAALRVLRSKLEAPEVVACLGDRTRALELLPPPRRVEVELTVQVWPGDTPLPVLDSAPTDPKLSGPLDADELSALLGEAKTALEACYAEGLARDPGLWGRLQIHVETDPHGSVKRAREAESQFPDRAVARCAVDHVRKIMFKERSKHPSAFEIALRMGRLPDRPAGATP